MNDQEYCNKLFEYKFDEEYCAQCDIVEHCANGLVCNPLKIKIRERDIK